MSELKPCPFCGNNEPTIRVFRGKNGWRDRYAVICRYDEGGCGAESGLYHYEIEAVEAWNRRETAQPDRGYVEQIKWERDLAIQQLKDLGYVLGEKPRDINVPTKMEDGTLSITVDMDITQVGRVILTQKGTKYCEVYYCD